MFGLAADSRLALALVWPLLAASGTRPAALVTTASPETLLARASGDFPGVLPAVEAGSLRIFRYGATASPVADGERLRREMDHFGIGRDALLVLHGIEPPDCASPAVFAAWRHWAEQRGHILILVFEAEAAFLETAREFAGLARLRDLGSGAMLEMLHWFGPQGLACRQSFALAGPPGSLAVRSDPAAAVLPHRAPDEDAVYAMTAALGRHGAPSHWRLFDTLETLLAAAAGAQGATCVLAFDSRPSLSRLLPTVFRLRRDGGPGLKIVVRELDVRLRYSQESVFRILGGNLVVPAEVGHSRFLGLVETVQGQAVRPCLPVPGETAAAALTPIAERGYLPASRFVEAVRTALAGSAALAVQCALVRLPVVPGLQPADALRYCALRRAGDICTADRESVHVFLFACRESDLALALHRLFRLPVTELFAGEVRCLSRGAILGALDNLAADADLPDLSPLLAGRDGDGQNGDDTALLPARGMVRREAPSPAVRRPLELKRPVAQVREDLPA